MFDADASVHERVLLPAMQQRPVTTRQHWPAMVLIINYQFCLTLFRQQTL